MPLVKLIIGLSLALEQAPERSGPSAPAPVWAVERARIPRPVVPIDPFFNSDPTYDRITLYSPDHYGYLRPRVNFSPLGPYDPLTGRPYPYLSVRPIQWR